MMLVTRMMDAVIDPVMDAITDRTGWLLSYFGYQPNATQNQTAINGINGIMLMMSLIPTVGTVVAVIALWFTGSTTRRSVSWALSLPNVANAIRLRQRPSQRQFPIPHRRSVRRRLHPTLRISP